MSTVKAYNVDSGDTTSLTLKTNGTTAVTVDSSQNVGIGTSSPGGKLEVSGQADFTTVVGAGYGVRVRSPSGSATPAILQFTNNPVTAQWYAIQSPSADVLAFNNGGGTEKMRIDASGNLGIGVTPAGTGALEIKAGTASVSPLEFNAGTNLTSANAGSVEYDGTNFYVTPTVGTTEQRGIIPSTQQFVLSANGSAFGAAIGNFFGSNSAIQLAASTTYSIEAYCYFLKTTAGTATWAPTFSSAPTVTHATIEYTPITGFTTSIITGAMVVAEATANAVATMTFTATGSLTTAVYHVAKFKVFVTTNAATNLRFNVTQSAGTMTPQAGSWYTVRKVATNSGNFVA
jgi:hypothetical protein